jgi:DHA2 family multidrug resistance protein
VREQIHSNFIGQHVVNGSIDVNHVLAQLSGLFTSHGAAIAPARALASLSATVQREANTLAYIDGFWLTVWFAIVALALVALMGRAPQGPFTPKPDLGWLPRRLREAFAR